MSAPRGDTAGAPRGDGAGEALAMLLAAHGAARYADEATLAACLSAGPERGSPDPGRDGLRESARS